MSPESALFRHAVRMSLVLCAGYAFIQFTGLQHGYWILLTSLFVCQPNYNATRHRLALRIIGTLVGVALGLPILWLVPSLEGQLALIVITGAQFWNSITRGAITVWPIELHVVMRITGMQSSPQWSQTCRRNLRSPRKCEKLRFGCSASTTP